MSRDIGRTVKTGTPCRVGGIGRNLVICNAITEMSENCGPGIPRYAVLIALQFFFDRWQPADGGGRGGRE